MTWTRERDKEPRDESDQIAGGGGGPCRRGGGHGGRCPGCGNLARRRAQRSLGRQRTLERRTWVLRRPLLGPADRVLCRRAAAVVGMVLGLAVRLLLSPHRRVRPHHRTLSRRVSGWRDGAGAVDRSGAFERRAVAAPAVHELPRGRDGVLPEGHFLP